MFNVSIATIDSTFFQNYANLEEIEIYESPHLQAFDGNSLRHLTHLRKFILRDNGLKRMPSLEMTDEHKMDVEIDLSGNQIQYIGDGRVRSVRARSLRLNNNRIKEIAGYAFSGSNFLKLALNGNEELTDLSSDAFKGITELHHLDLSDTSISQLPIIGLKNLKTLALKNVPTLKKLPPVLSFTHLETAHFTYPHHCCLFKYVDDVVEGENGLYKNNAKEIHHRICKERETHRSRRQQWLRDADELLDLGDEDPPAFDPSEIGATRCLAVEEVATVQGFYQNITCTPQPDAFNPCENIVGLWVLRRAIWPVCTAAIVGNVLVWVILALAFEKRMRVHYLFMINLAIADFTTGVYLAVLAVQDVRTGDEYYRHAVSWQTGWGCSMAGFFAVLSSELSITSMFFIAFEMAYNTRNAFYGQRLRFSVACAMMAGGWTFAITMASMPLLGVSSYSTASICLPLRLHNMADRAYLIFFLLFNLLAFIAMVDPSTPSRAEDNLIIKKMVWLVGADFLCWFPTLFFGLFWTAALTTAPQDYSTKRPYESPTDDKEDNEHLRCSVEVGSPTRLGVSQMTSLDSTPRGSNCSSMPTMDTDMPETPRRSSPRVSFQDNVSYSSRPSSDSTRPSFAWSKRISSIPEVSDLSEHSSESHHEHIPTQKKPRRSESQPRFGLSLNRFGFGRQRQSSGGVDSGRGSLASVSTRDTGERTSLASRDGGLIDTDSGVTSKLILPPSPSPNPVTATPRRSSWMPRLLSRQRTSSMIRPQLVVSDYTQIDDNPCSN
ncbi:leucine Rich repeat-containing domain protein [Ancylostoma ceylanicum]|uniref:Leucine Rich repeat-containing domain protein n=1 Tax=Ancylostoma ceylanicum TaxID=53326 RepID=A0A0D6LS95_9BILA|nr:leucine Rich repeat-containing domain protein [Ancylostoma ceylanicum]